MIKFLKLDAFFVIFVLSQMTALHSLEYRDLERMGVSCSPRDTCTSSMKRTFNSTNCECDRKCSEYNDCCIDAPHISRTQRLERTCMALNTLYQGVYTISKCQTDWRGPTEVQQKCENVDDISDPIMAAPATNIENDITYRNRYCAECNSADLSQLQSWSITIECNSLAEANSTYGNISDEYVASHLSYEVSPPNQNKWGVYYWNSDSTKEVFYPCVLDFYIPAYLETHVRFCRPNIISTCAKNWRRNSVRRQCEAYMAVVYLSSFTYRNPHCAVCNNLELNNFACLKGVLISTKPPLSFSLLLDINMMDGNRVGLKGCSKGETWDQFFKKCRTLVCALRGRVMVNGICVRE